MTATLRETLDALHATRGYLTPALVVEELADPRHPHHGRLTWDDTEAARLHRLHEAAQLIRSVRVVYRQSDDLRPAGTIRVYHPTDDAQIGSAVYKSLDAIVADPISTEVLLRQMERDWKALHRRYAEFKEFWDLVRQSEQAAS